MYDSVPVARHGTRSGAPCDSIGRHRKALKTLTIRSVLNNFAMGEKELAMSLTFRLNEPCPKCRKPIMQSVIELHPTQRDLALHNFHCADCGPIKTEVLSLKPPARPSDVAA